MIHTHYRLFLYAAEWALQESNLGLLGYEPSALPTELRARNHPGLLPL